MNAGDQSDAILLDRIRDGDETAFDALFQRYLATLQRFAEERLPPGLRRRLSAADVVQEARIVALERCAEFENRGDRSFRNWLMKIVEIRVKRAVRRHVGTEKRAAQRELSRGHRPDTEQFVGNRPSPSQAAIAAELRELAEQAMRALPDHYQEVLRIVRQEELSLREVAERTGRSRDAAKKMYSRAISRFRQEFDRLRGTSDG